MIRKFFCITAVVFAGLIAGLLLGTGMDQYALHDLNASPWITTHQLMDDLFRRMLPTLWNATLLLLIIATFIAKGYGRWLFGAATLLLLIGLIITLHIEVPMNRLIATWNPAAPPSDWTGVRDNWLHFHSVRTMFVLSGFVSAAVGLTKIRASVKRY